jgi:hypothetical protein
LCEKRCIGVILDNKNDYSGKKNVMREWQDQDLDQTEHKYRKNIFEHAIMPKENSGVPLN